MRGFTTTGEPDLSLPGVKYKLRLPEDKALRRIFGYKK
jgi:hypothetical protein